MPIDLPLNEITSDLCHDINNPLAIVCGTSQQLGRLVSEETWDPTRAKALVERMDRNLERITRLVRGLAILAKKTQNETPKTTGVEKLIELVVPFCEEILQKGKVEFRFNKKEGMPPFLCRTLSTSQALLVLLRHACAVIAPLESRWIELKFDFTPTHGLISITRPSVPNEKEEELKQAPALFFPKEIFSIQEGKLTCTVAQPLTTVLIELPLDLNPKASS